MLRLCLLSTLATSVVSAASQGIVTKDKTPLRQEANNQAKVLGVFQKRTLVDVLSKTDDGQFFRVEAATSSGKKVQGFVQAQSLQVQALQNTAAQPEVDTASDRHQVVHPWGIGLGFGGYAASGESSFQVEGELRYRWDPILESILGLNIGFGSSTVLGGSLAQRAYINSFDRLLPFFTLGYRIGDFSELQSSAWTVGLGFQVLYGPVSYFEVSVNYLYRKFFDDAASNVWVLSGGSGIRF
jgi:hypothetical protein